MRPMMHTMVALGATAFVLAGCVKEDADDEPLTQAEAAQALEEAALDAQAASLVNGSVEITTSFTIGSAVEGAAAEIKSFVESQLPCAEISLAGAKLTVAYGKKPGNCLYRGKSYGGTHTVEVKKAGVGDVEIAHSWSGMTDRTIQVDGTAKVTWSASSKSRKVEHAVTWRRLSDGRSGTGSGAEEQTVLEGGIVEGIKVDGRKTWTGARGAWTLDIDAVEVRWVDPVPQAGSYRLTAPSGRSLSLGFTRSDADTIRVTVSSGDQSFPIDVNTPNGGGGR